MRQPEFVLLVILSLVVAGCVQTRSPTPAGGESPPVPEIPPAIEVPPAKEPRPVSGPPSVPITKSSPDAVRPDTSSDGLLRYFAYVRKLQGAELAKEHDAARQLFAAARTDFNRMRYAMLLSIPGAVFSDDARALEAIEPLLKNQNSVLHGVAFMLNATIQEQRRSQGLQQKLDALRSLEKDLIEREGGKRK